MNRKAQIAIAEVDNPNYSRDHPENLGNPRTIMVSINRRASALIELERRRALEPHHVRAGKRFRKAWDIMHGAHGKSFSEHVDGRRQPSVSESIIDAGQELGRCKAVLKERSYQLVCEVCGQDKALSETSYVKQREPQHQGRAKLTAADYLRDALDDLASLYRFC